MLVLISGLLLKCSLQSEEDSFNIKENFLICSKGIGKKNDTLKALLFMTLSIIWVPLILS